MALGLNHALLVGTLVRDPDLRYTPAGLAVLRLDLAGDDHLHDEEGTVRARPWYQRATVFGTQAERVVDHVRGGTPVMVDGHLEQRTFQGEDGETRRTLDVVGRRIEILGLGGRDGEDAFAVDARDQPRLRDAVNAIRLLGNLTRDAEVRRTEGGHLLARFAVAVNERRGEESKAHFVEILAWRDLARACEALDKGAPVYVEGRLVTDGWTDDEGRRRWTSRVEARRLEVIKGLPRPADKASPLAEGSRPEGEGTEADVPA